MPMDFGTYNAIAYQLAQANLANMLPETKARQEPEAVAVFLVFKGRTYLSVRSATERGFPNHYQNPGGKKEQGESAVFAAYREVKEETCLDIEVHRFRAIDRIKLKNYWVSTFYVELKLIESTRLFNAEPDKNGPWMPYYFHELYRLDPCVPNLKESARILEGSLVLNDENRR